MLLLELFALFELFVDESVLIIGFIISEDVLVFVELVALDGLILPLETFWLVDWFNLITLVDEEEEPEDVDEEDDDDDVALEDTTWAKLKKRQNLKFRKNNLFKCFKIYFWDVDEGIEDELVKIEFIPYINNFKPQKLIKNCS